MSVSYGQFRFATAPRTGTTWFVEACVRSGLRRVNKAEAHVPFSEAEQQDYKVSLVRHPYHWLVSYYSAIFPGSIGVPEIDRLRELQENRLIQTHFDFVLAYLEVCPGQVGRIFDAYKADTYLRLEDMPWAAIELFSSLGIHPAYRSRSKSLPPRNVTKQHRPFDPRLSYQVLLAENDLVERFDYF